MKKGRMVIILVSILIVLAVAVIFWKQSTDGGITGNIVKTYVAGCGNVGDVNGDGVLSSADSDLIKSFVLGVSTLTPYQRSIADLNDNGQITTLDSSYLNGYLNGYRTTFPLCSRRNLCIDMDFSNRAWSQYSWGGVSVWDTALDGVDPHVRSRADTYFYTPVSSLNDTCEQKGYNGEAIQLKSCDFTSDCYQSEAGCFLNSSITDDGRSVFNLTMGQFRQSCRMCVSGNCDDIYT